MGLSLINTFSAGSNVSFELATFLKMELIVIWDQSENKDELESKQSKKDDRGMHQQISKFSPYIFIL